MNASLLLVVLLLPAAPQSSQQSPSAEPAPVGTRLLDLDGDGALDLLSLHADGALVICRNVGPRQFLAVPQELPRVQVTEVLCSDLDGDDRPDLYLVSAGADVALIGEGGGRFRAATDELGLVESGTGLSAERLDVDSDGLEDLVVHNQGSDVLFWARADGRFEREERTSDGVVSTVGIPGAVLVDAGRVVHHEEPASDRSSAGGRPSVPASPGAPAGPAGLVAAPSPTSSPAPLMAISFDARYVNDNQNEVDSADIVDGSLTGADISTVSGNVGIGTTTPDAKMQIANVGGVDGVSMLGFGEGSGSGFFFESGFAGTDGNNFVSLSTNIAALGDIMTWKGSGNVGIGTTAPNSKLTVNGQIEALSGGVKFPDGSVQTKAAPGTANSQFLNLSTGDWMCIDSLGVVHMDFLRNKPLLDNDGTWSNAIAAYLMAPLHLPAGAQVLSITAHVYDIATGTADLQVILCRKFNTNGAVDEVVFTVPAGAVGDFSHTFVGGPLISATNGYYVLARPFGGWSGDSIRLQNLVIEWIMP